MTIPEDQIPTAKVLYTIVGGKVQYSSASGSSNDRVERGVRP
jgi:hypothetical protein